MAGPRCYLLEFAVLGLCLICQQSVNAHVLVYRRTTNQLIEEYNDLPAQFGPTLPPNGLKVFVVPASPRSFGCEHINRPPSTNYPPNAKFVVLISRGGECTFERKVRNAQSAGYHAAIVYNNEGDDLEQMSADNSSGIHIPAIFVGQTTGITLARSYSPDEVLIINDELPFNINTQLILPFSILIGLCFLIMVVYMIYKCIREQRRQHRYRLPKSMLKKIPVLRYTKNNTSIKYDTCVICLEEFVEDDKLRVLPCSHPYHTHCIDPWLTQNRRVCPICKRKVFTKGETRSNRSRQLSSDSVTDTDDDTTPLLQQRPQEGRVSAAASAGGSNASVASTSGAGAAPTAVAAAASDTTRHGTFRRSEPRHSTADNNSSDDENALLAYNNQSPGHRRVNPFDRTPNLPAHLAALFDEPRPSIWSRLNFRFLFRRQPVNISIAAPAFLERVETGDAVSSSLPINTTVNMAAALPTPTSNNILNPNLSGTFKDDDHMPPLRSIYEPIAVTTPGTDNSNSPPAVEASSESAFLQTPTQGGIGVAALPHSEGVDNNNRQFLI